MQDSGYLIVRRAEALLRAYSEAPTRRQDLLKRLREATRFLDPAAYRGMGRWPLDPYPSLDPASIEALSGAGLDMNSDRAARIKVRELVGDDPPEGYEERLLPTAGQAAEVVALLDAPADWEVIRVAVAPLDRTNRTLGYDVGWWGGAEFYSLISDSVVAPTWHPPAPEDFQELAREMRRLNEHLLFETPEDALDFRSFYTSKPWAETEGEHGDFKIVRVDAV
jgi:hypothetical protein